MSFLSRYLPASLVLALGLGVTFAATVWVGRWERLSRQIEFQKQTNNLTTSLQRTINRYNDLLLSISDFYSATGSQVDEAAFRQFVQRALQSYPGIQALEWAPLVPHAERAAYEQALQARTGLQQAKIMEGDRAGNLIAAAVRAQYIPVTFVEPWQGNEVALGYDLTSDQTRRIALERSRDTGMLAATGRIQLVQEIANNQYSFLVFVPIYRQVAQTFPERRQQLQGYILGVFRIADVVEESLHDLNYETDFYILDQTAQPNEQFLGFYDANKDQLITQTNPKLQQDLMQRTPCLAASDCAQLIHLGQRQWRVVFLPSSANSPLWSTLATLLIGLMMTAMLLVYLSRWQAELRRTRELSDLKLRLFSMASHELRTPLSVIMLSAQSLEANRERLTPQQQANTLDRIQLAAKRMGQLVSDILTLTRAEAGKLELNPEIVALEPFCQQLCDQIQLKSGQDLSWAIAAPCTQAYLDKNLLHSILINLLSNAAKYSPENSKIQLQITETGSILNFQVHDQGIGIPQEAIAHVFEAFYRGKNVGTIQGTGLGLAVVKTCVDLHQGRLIVDSQPDCGTCVTVMLPRIE